jgi:hypothetical protein
MSMKDEDTQLGSDKGPIRRVFYDLNEEQVARKSHLLQFRPCIIANRYN